MLKNMRIKTKHNKMEFKIFGINDLPCNEQLYLIQSLVLLFLFHETQNLSWSAGSLSLCILVFRLWGWNFDFYCLIFFFEINCLIFFCMKFFNESERRWQVTDNRCDCVWILPDKVPNKGVMVRQVSLFGCRQA